MWLSEYGSFIKNKTDWTLQKEEKAGSSKCMLCQVTMFTSSYAKCLTLSFKNDILLYIISEPLNIFFLFVIITFS